jgi:hypothetical protein
MHLIDSLAASIGVVAREASRRVVEVGGDGKTRLRLVIEAMVGAGLVEGGEGVRRGGVG